MSETMARVILDALILPWLVGTWFYEGHHRRCTVVSICPSCGGIGDSKCVSGQAEPAGETEREAIARVRAAAVTAIEHLRGMHGLSAGNARQQARAWDELESALRTGGALRWDTKNDETP